MQRISLTPRQNWQQTVESQGLTFHTLENGTPYWDESAAYKFTAAEIDTLEAAGYQLRRCASPPPSTSSTKSVTPNSTSPSSP